MNGVKLFVRAATLLTLALLTLPLHAATAGDAAQSAAESGASDEVARLIEEARQAMALRHYPRAIQIYTKLLELPAHKYSRDALEYLGVARERRGQMAQAKRVYKKYIALYPDTKGAVRVQQRLTAIVTAEQSPQKKLRQAKKVKEEREAWQIYGGVSQYYRYDNFKLNDNAARATVSQLESSLDYNARLRSGETEIRTRFSGSYDYSFLDSSADRKLEIRNLYVDSRDFRSGLSARIGRQRQSSGGVLGRFDGISAAMQVAPQYKVNLVAGYPVLTSALDSVDTSTYFFGAGVDADILSDAWDLSAYFIEQHNERTIDRRAVGAEVRYFTPGKSAVALIDYDLHFGELNTFLALASWRFNNDLTLSTTIDLRNSPAITTSNALIGQSVSDIPALLDSYSESQIKTLARDRTADSRSYSVNLSLPLGERVQLGGEVTLSSLSATPASGGVEATPSADGDTYYTVDMTISDIFMKDDFTIITLRQSDTSTAQTNTFMLNTRLPLSRALRINPRLRADLSTYKRDNTEQSSYNPSVRINYRWKKHYNFEAEFGWERAEHNVSPTLTDTERSYYFDIGYRMDL